MIHSFKYKDICLLLDVESGALHMVDEQAYNVAKAFENGTDPYSCGVERSIVDEILAELDELKCEGSVDAPEMLKDTRDTAPVIKSMCLNIAHDCNLRCKYCFAGTGEYHSERMLMSAETGMKALDFLIANSGSRRHLEVDLFGGEPLINVPAVKMIVAHGRELEKRSGKEIAFTVTTNGLNLNGELMDWLNEEMHNIVISLDGRREVHDAMRPTRTGAGSYDIIAKNAVELIKRRGDREHYVRGTFTRSNLDFTEDVKAMLDLGFTQVSLEPVVLPEESPYSILEEHVAGILDEYDKLTELYMRRRSENRPFNFFHFMMDLSGGPCLYKRVAGCGAGVEYIAVTPEGDIYPCHQFVGIKEFCMGSVLTGEFDRSIQASFKAVNVLTKPECRSCWAKYFCSGGCAANAYIYNGAIDKPYGITCEFERKRTECALYIYAKEHE